jgi:hypothetical protein
MLWSAGLGYLVEYHDWGKVVAKTWGICGHAFASAGGTADVTKEKRGTRGFANGQLFSILVFALQRNQWPSCGLFGFINFIIS